MKKILLFSAFLGCFALGHAQTKNVVVETAGTLSTLIPAEEVSTLTTLTVSGSINKTDLDTLNGMPALTTLDLGQANIVAETVGEVTYAANTIPEETFYFNKNLQSVTFPSSLEYVGRQAFANCVNITAIDLSVCPNLVEIGYQAFGAMDGVKSLSLKGCSKLTTIGDYAFSNDFFIESIDFSGCSALSSIGLNAFNNVRETLTTLDLSSCTALTEIGKSSFKSLKKMTSLILPENIEVIGMGAFYACHSLETITIPASVDSIAPHSFGQPKALKTVICKGINTKAAEMAFSNNTYVSSPSTKPAEENYSDKGYTLVVPKGCADTYRAGIEWAKFPIIEEAESGAIDATESLSDVHVYAAGNAVVVEGAAAGTQVSVIGLSGYAAQNAVADGSTLSLTIEQKGLFLVKVGTSVFKVIL